jgi:hypothetical protein
MIGTTGSDSRDRQADLERGLTRLKPGISMFSEIEAG